MREIAEFRVVEEFASRLFSDNEGKRLGDSVRKVELATNDPRFSQIGKLQREIDATFGRSFFHGWHVHRHYTKDELALATCFQMTISTVFEPTGEECGTKYDESTACSQCGAGAAQISNLRLDMRKVPKNKDIACTIADELIVSQRLAERMVDTGLTGFELRPVLHKTRDEDGSLDLHQVPTGREILQKAKDAGAPYPTGKFYIWLNRAENLKLWEQTQAEYVVLKGRRDHQGSKPLPVWYQLVVTSVDAEIVPPTRVGINPFDEDINGECRCSYGDLIGLNLLSEVSISAESRGKTDIVSSRQFVGTRRGLLRPKHIILVSPKVWQLFESEMIKGIKFEVAHLV